MCCRSKHPNLSFNRVISCFHLFSSLALLDMFLHLVLCFLLEMFSRFPPTPTLFPFSCLLFSYSFLSLLRVGKLYIPCPFFQGFILQVLSFCCGNFQLCTKVNSIMNFCVPIIQLKPLSNLKLFILAPHFPHGPLDYTERNSSYHNT